MLASRFARARATAVLIQEHLGCDVRFERVLEVGYPVSDAATLFAGRTPGSTLMVVGHNPQLSALMGGIVNGLPAEEVGLKTGQCAVLNVDPTEWAGSGRELERLRMPGDE